MLPKHHSSPGFGMRPGRSAISAAQSPAGPKDLTWGATWARRGSDDKIEASTRLDRGFRAAAAAALARPRSDPSAPRILAHASVAPGRGLRMTAHGARFYSTSSAENSTYPSAGYFAASLRTVVTLRAVLGIPSALSSHPGLTSESLERPWHHQ